MTFEYDNYDDDGDCYYYYFYPARLYSSSGPTPEESGCNHPDSESGVCSEADCPTLRKQLEEVCDGVRALPTGWPSSD